MLCKSGKGTVQRAAQAAVQSVVAKSGKDVVQGAGVLCRGTGYCAVCRVRCRLLSGVQWRGLAKVLCRVLCRLLTTGGHVWQRCCAVGAAVAKSGKDVLPDLAILKVGKRWLNLLEPAVPRTGNPCFQDWEAWVPTFGNC